jgi:hypothetical protein
MDRNIVGESEEKIEHLYKRHTTYKQTINDQSPIEIRIIG